MGKTMEIVRSLRQKLAGLVLLLLVISFGAPSVADAEARVLGQWRDKEYSAFQESTVGHRILLLLSDGERERAIRLCARECRLHTLDALDIVPRIEREMREDLEMRLPYLEALESSEQERLEALDRVPYLAMSPLHRDPLLDRLDRLRADSPTDLHVVWAHFRALLVARRNDDALNVARELGQVCGRASVGVCEPADGLFLEYALYANKAEMALWLADDSVSEAEQFREVRAHLERAIEAAERLEYDYAVPPAFPRGYSWENYHPLIQARLTYADAMLEAGLHQQALFQLEGWLDTCPRSHGSTCHELRRETLTVLQRHGLRSKVDPRTVDFDLEAR